MTNGIKGHDDVRRYLLETAPKRIRAAARGGVKAGVEVIAEEARRLCASDDVRQDIKVAVKVTDDGVRGAVQVKGPHAYIGRWLEYGTSPHYISVDDSQRGGRSAARVNRLAKQGVLVINGQPVGKTVLHPGARPHPFLRPALDLREAEARKAAQTYVRVRLKLGDGGEAVRD